VVAVLIYDELWYDDVCYVVLMCTMVVPDFGSGCGKSSIWPFFANLAKAGSIKIFSRMPVPLQYIQLITDKAKAADCQVVYNCNFI